VIDAATIDSLAGGKLGVLDIACPVCGPLRRSGINQRRRVLRLWRPDQNFATYYCARCGEAGRATHRDVAAGDSRSAEARTRIVGEAAKHEADSKAKRIATAQRLWSRHQPITEGSPPFLYLRKRGFTGTIPPTLAYLPPFRDFPAAMIAAFGMVTEAEPGVIVPPKAVAGVHITRLTSEGDKAPDAEGNAKIALGSCKGAPICISPPNDLLGMAVTEGIEDALSVYQSTGLGVWAAGSAGFMPALAPLVPDYIECVTIFVDDDDAGQRGAKALASALFDRGIEVRLTAPQGNANIRDMPCNPMAAFAG
jgi:hypothetical protein